jgi:hypothetical protein
MFRITTVENDGCLEPQYFVLGTSEICEVVLNALSV